MVEAAGRRSDVSEKGTSASAAVGDAPRPSAAASRRLDLPADAIVFGLVLWACAPLLRADYLFNDETIYVGLPAGSEVLSPTASARFYGIASGRWLAGLLMPLAPLFAHGDPVRMRMVRLVALTALAATAVVTRRLLRRGGFGVTASGLLAIAVFSQRAFVGLAAYSFLVGWYVAGLALSLGAFALSVPVDAGAPVSRLRLAGSLGCLLAAMQIQQAFAFFGVVPLVAIVLRDWSRRRRQALSLIGLMAIALAVSVVLYAAGLRWMRSSSVEGYSRGVDALSLAAAPFSALLAALDPRRWWTAFRLWSTPFPFERLAPIGTLNVWLSCGIMLSWTVLVATAAVVEARRRGLRPADLAAKWSAVAVLLALAFFPILADSPRSIPPLTSRPHVALVATSTVLILAAWALSELSVTCSAIAKRAMAAACIGLVAWWCIGARSSAWHGVVAPRVAQISFLRSALDGKGQVSRIVVVLPASRGCLSEPCDGWMGRILPSEFHARQAGAYRWVLGLVRGGRQPWPRVGFVSAAPEEPLPPGTVVVDWNELARREARRRGARRRSLRGSAPTSPPPVDATTAVAAPL